MTSSGEARAPVQALLGLGANLGDREHNLSDALRLLDATAGIRLLAVSSLYESDPVGYLDQPRFLNLVAGVETTLEPEGLLDAVLGIERRLGRIRTFPNAPRTLDIDLLFYGEHPLRTERLTLPHPRYAERPFVVVPLEEVLAHPAFNHPQWKTLRAELKTNPNREGLRRLPKNNPRPNGPI